MGDFLDAASRVLSDAGGPLSAEDIVMLAQEKGWLHSHGRTPAQTMKSKLSMDILTKKDRSLFMRTSEGRFGLRSWKELRTEYIADRFQKALLDEDVVVFPACSLSKYVPLKGLNPTTLKYGRQLLAECHRMSRRLAEQDYSVIQLISVFVVRFRDRYLTYKRTRRLPEKRLHGRYSVIFGGHVTWKDVDAPLFDIFAPENYEIAFLRELGEELRWHESERPEIAYKGLLYDDSVELSSQHLGISFDVVLKSSQYQIGERGFLTDAKFESLDEIEARIEKFENWSVLVARYEREQTRKRIGN